MYSSCMLENGCKKPFRIELAEIFMITFLGLRGIYDEGVGSLLDGG